MRDWSNYSNVDMDFFREWSQELAYIIGLFLSDGSISDYYKWKMYYVSICSSDEDIINKILKITKCSRKPYNDKRSIKTVKNIKFSGKRIWSFFKDLGFDNNKSFSAKVPKQIPKYLYFHFIRGIFDGDGSVSIRKENGRFYPHVNVVGTRNTVCFIGKIIPCYNTIDEVNGLWRIHYNGENVIEFLNLIYSKSNFHMNRKHKIYLEIIKKGYTNPFNMWSDEELVFLKTNYQNLKQKEIANILNRSCKAINIKAFRLGLKKRRPLCLKTSQ